MQPYPNPNYYSQYQQPQFNPYLQRMENLQQFQQTLQPTNQIPAIGKVVESMDIVKVTDIPMDGNVYYFPKADGEEIYTKQFMPNGQTRILTFKPLLDSEPSNLSNDVSKIDSRAFSEVLEGIQNDIKSLSEKIDEIYKPKKAKKESIENE